MQDKTLPVTRTDPMQIRLAIETLSTLANGIDLDVPSAAFPLWMGALGAGTAHACRIEGRPGVHVWFNGRLFGGKWWSIECDLAQLLDVSGRPVDVPTGGASALYLTRDQVDYLAEVES